MPLTNELPYTIIPVGNKQKILKNPSRAFLYGANWKVDLLSGIKSDFNSKELLNVLDLEEKSVNRIVHLSYEAGYLFNKGEDLIKSSDWMALDLQYEKIEFKELCSPKIKSSLKLLSKPTSNDYNSLFKKGYKLLEKGECYQFNLTFPFRYSFKGDFDSLCEDLYKDTKMIGEFAHSTYIPSEKWGILSNSPECLYEMDEKKIDVKPIKGTIKDFDGAWEKLISSEKDRAELFMITDLLRNDLNKISPKARVIKLRAPLKVPGLIHQYSHITLENSSDITHKKIVESLFPSGSITGAPKIKVMGVLNQLEKRSRGAYCGSTLFFDGDIVRASVNIRTVEVNLKTNELIYCAGGGVTLLSKKEDEYKEMISKVDSFTLVLQ